MTKHIPLVAALLFALPALAGAQDTVAVRELTERQKADIDALSRMRGVGAARETGARAIARADSVYRTAVSGMQGGPTRVDTVRTLRVDTVRVTVVRVDTVVVASSAPRPTPPPAPTPAATDTAPQVVVTQGVPAGTIFTHPYAPPANGALFAELPRDTVPITVPAVQRTITVTSLQAALDTAKANDRLLIPRNHRTEQLQVRNTSRLGWVTIQGTDSTSVITTSGTGAQSAIAVLSRAHHVRFLGPLRVTATGPDELTAMFRSNNGELALDQFPHDIILDGVTFDAGTSLVRRCVWPDGIRMAVVRSRLLNCATRSGDAQAILVLGGPGPYRFQWNYLEGSHQCFNSGGGDPATPGLVPSDVVFSDNECNKPLRWHYTTPGQYTGEQRQVKTAIETKNIRRALFERNVIRHLWPDAQVGFAFLLKSVNQDGACTWCTTSDVTVRYNRVIDVASGFNLAANPQGIVVPLTRVSVYDNVIEPFKDGDGIPLQLLGATRDVIFLHNTFASASNQALAFDEAPGIRTVIAANVIPHGQYGVKGNSTADGAPTIAAWMPGGLFQTNVIAGAGSCALYPSGTLCPAAIPATLPLGYDGRPVGADLARVSAATANAVTP